MCWKCGLRVNERDRERQKETERHTQREKNTSFTISLLKWLLQQHGLGLVTSQAQTRNQEFYKITIQTFLKGRHRNRQQVHGKILHTTNHQRNANENHSEKSFQNEYHQKYKR